MQPRILLLLVPLLFGCSSVAIDDYRKTGPAFDLFGFFTGETHAWGVVEDRFGKLRRRFTVEVVGTLEADGRLRLDETFRYDDGELQRRVWLIRRLGPDRYEGEADDNVGTASGRSAGAVLNWRYRMAVPIGGRSWTLAFDDWMVRLDERTLYNRAALSAFGLRVADATLFFSRESGR